MLLFLWLLLGLAGAFLLFTYALVTLDHRRELNNGTIIQWGIYSVIAILFGPIACLMALYMWKDSVH